MPRSTYPAFNTIGGRIALARCKAGLKQAELADRVGCPSSKISAWEHNAKQPILLVLCRIAKALNVPVERLLGLKEK